MRIFKETHGRFKCINSTGYSASTIRVDGLGALRNGVFVGGFNITKNEKKGIIQCFNGSNHIYAFGHDPESSNFSITINVFFERTCDYSTEHGDAGKILQWYRKNRVSKKQKSITMTIDSKGAVSGILTAIQINFIDPALNLASITLIFTDVNP